jgi:ribonuclease I
MNPVTDILFTATWFFLLVWAVRSVISGWRSKPVRDFNSGRISGEWTTEVSKPVHPEMRDVKPGTELLGVNFEKKTECDLEEYKALQQRIEELKSELEDPWEDDDDDDGNVPSPINR